MDELGTMASWVMIIPFFGVLVAISCALAFSVAEIVITILTRLKWRLLDFLERKFDEE